MGIFDITTVIEIDTKTSTSFYHFRSFLSLNSVLVGKDKMALSWGGGSISDRVLY